MSIYKKFLPKCIINNKFIKKFYNRGDKIKKIWRKLRASIK